MDINLRINKAKSTKTHKSFIYSYNIRVVSLEGIRKAFYDLAFKHTQRKYLRIEKERKIYYFIKNIII